MGNIKSDSGVVRVIFLILVFGLILFLLLELTARIHYFGWSGLSYSRVNSVKSIGTTGYLRPSSYPGVRYELLPDIDGYFKLKPFRTNSQGLHDREYEREKPANTFRVAVIGSSYTMGGGVDLEDIYHSVIEDELNSRGTKLHYEFINYAVGGYLPDQQLATLRYRALPDKPDLVIFTVTPRNAPYMFVQPGTRTQEFRPHKIQYPFFKSFFLRWLKEADVKVEDMPGPPLVPDSASLDIIGHLKEIRREFNIPVVIFDLQYRGTSRSEVIQRLERVIRDSDIYWVDMREAFANTNAEDFWVFSFDQHPNALAHKRFAAVLGEFLESNNLLGQDALKTK